MQSQTATVYCENFSTVLLQAVVFKIKTWNIKGNSILLHKRAKIFSYALACTAFHTTDFVLLNE